MKIAIDCANGATFEVAPIVLKRLGAEVISIGDQPTGKNINLNCGSTHIDSLVELVKISNADVGFAFDGDGDRCLAVDENEKILDGDEIMSICGFYLKQRGKLNKNSIVATVMSNLGLFTMGKKFDINIEQTKVGDRYVLEKMLEKNYSLGGEQSGHIIFLEHNTTGDGLLTALHILKIMYDKQKKLSELNNLMEVLPQVLVNAKVSNTKKNNYMMYDEIKNEISMIQEKFSDDGRVLVRPSGTEPLIRVMIEGRDKSILLNEANRLAKIMEKVLN